MNTDLIHQLFEEYTLWYANLIKDSGRLPRSVSGVSEDGNQFTLIVDGLDFNHIERHNFIKSVLESEQSIAYAYGSLMMTGTDKKDEFEERLVIIAANSQHYVWGEWRVFRNSDGDAIGLQHSSTHEGDDPDDNPGAWFLTNALSFSKKDRVKFEGIWKHLREDAQFRNRNNFESKQTSDKVLLEDATQAGTVHLLRAPKFEQLGRVTTVVQPLPIMTKKTPREIMAADYGSVHGVLPIRGGWGYTKEDACIIDKNDPLVDPLLPFDGVGVEFVFVEKRIYEEMIIFRPNGEKFSGIKWNLQEQRLIEEGGRNFDKLVFEITAFRDNDWEELKAEYEGPHGYGHPDFDEESHERKRQEKMVRFTREFWFDVTSFHGQGVVITDKLTGKKTMLPAKSFKFTEKFKKLFGND